MLDKANIEENPAVYKGDHQASIRPDIHVSQDSTFPASGENISSAVVAEPLVLRRAPHPTRHVEIVDKDGRVITAIEFLSPWNKVGSRVRELYTCKQIDYIDAGVRRGSHALDQRASPERGTSTVVANGGRTFGDSRRGQVAVEGKCTLPNYLPT